MLENVSMAGMAIGGGLVTFEASALLATTLFRKQMEKRCPRVLHHAAVGVKTTSYRCCAGADTFMVAWFVTGNPLHAGGVVGFEFMTKFFLYYGHEWVWNRPFFARFVRGSIEKDKGYGAH